MLSFLKQEKCPTKRRFFFLCFLTAMLLVAVQLLILFLVLVDEAVAAVGITTLRYRMNEVYRQLIALPY